MIEETPIREPEPAASHRRAVKAVRAATVGYGVLLVALALLFRHVGEQWWLTSVLLYVPPHAWLLPLPPLVALAWFFDRRSLLGLGGCLAVAVFGLFKFQVSLPASPRPGASALKIVINNIGENNDTSVDDFVFEQRPDLIVLQDTKRIVMPEIRRLYPEPDWQIRKEGEHLLISRFPIVESRLLPRLWRRSPAAVFRVDWDGRFFSLYSVHIPTPRTEFRHLGGGKARDGILDAPGIGRVDGVRMAMQARVREVKELAEIAAADPDPVLLVGDFNMPRWGYLYSHFGSRFTDAFDARGFGFGFTLSGEKGNPLLWLGPWVRIDYLFCSPAWRPLSCSVEPRRPSQHRGLVATFEWQASQP